MQTSPADEMNPGKSAMNFRPVVPARESQSSFGVNKSGIEGETLTCDYW